MPSPIPHIQPFASPESGVELAGLARAIGQIGSMVDDFRERIRLLEGVITNFPGGLSLFDGSLRMLLCNDEQKRLLDYPADLFAHGYPTLEEIFRFNAARGEYGPGGVEEHVARRMALVRERRAHVYERTRPNGIVVEVRGVPIDGGGFLTTYLDVTEQRRAQATIAHMAHHDALTDLPNRMLFNDRMQKAVALARRGGLMAVHCIDVDRFKSVNDRFGHGTGDELLIAIAARLNASVRDNDTVARLGGDEFAIVQTGIHAPDDAAVLARRIVDACARPFEIGTATIQVGASVGIALCPGDGVSADELLSKADTALYRSKSEGRSRFTLHHPL